MPGWKPEILRRLAPLNLAPAREAEITRQPFNERIPCSCSACDAPLRVLPGGNPLDIFAAIHQRQERAQHSRFRFIRQPTAAGRQTRQLRAVVHYILPHFTEAFPRACAHRRLAPHQHARLLQLQREMQHAPPLRFQLLRYSRLASDHFAIHIHGIPGLSGWL